MTDRELLELAAKAAGYEIQESIIGGESKMYHAGDLLEWNPLLDDGDAMRLACDLSLRVYPVARTVSGEACSAIGSVTCERLSEVESHSLGVRVSTRRAIVRAAAEIGKTMEQSK